MAIFKLFTQFLSIFVYIFYGFHINLLSVNMQPILWLKKNITDRPNKLHENMYLTTCSESVKVHVEKETNKTHSVFLKVV